MQAKKGLKDYHRKRNFKKTKEPKGNVKRSGPRPSHKKRIFVIQEHHASHLHYDFRLEEGGVLKSWAVPKEPSMDPSIKRLAVEVEDHPIDYASFEGVIPQGEYGGGTVSIWDEGTFEPEGSFSTGLEQGKLRFKLHGKKLKGTFSLVLTRVPGGKRNWLLLKSRDEHAVDSQKLQDEKAAKSMKVKLKRPGLVAFSNLNKVMFPEIGVTKGEVLEYYHRISPYLLPHLKDRPITLERLPDGVGRGPQFWQKNTPSHYPDWIPRAELQTEAGKKVNYAIVNNLETLLYMVNQGALTFHTWMSRMSNLDCPDFVLFDLDPGKSSFWNVVDIAHELNSLLRDKGFDPMIKTSGKSGLHLLVPWQHSGGYDEAREWAFEVANELVGECSKIATVARTKDRRQGKVYIDVMQNARGHQVVPPYVLRPTPWATVSMPITERELSENLDPESFTLRTAIPRLVKLKKAA